MSPTSVLGTLLLVALGFPVSPAQTRQTGEVLFTDGKAKPFVFLAGPPTTALDINKQTLGYSQDVGEIFKLFNQQKIERLPKISLKGLKRLDLLPFSPDERALFLGPKGQNCDAPNTWCIIRKVSLTFSDGRKRANLFVVLDPMKWAIGPEKEQYFLGYYDIAAVVIQR
jgi:hypothetical protein